MDVKLYGFSSCRITSIFHGHRGFDFILQSKFRLVQRYVRNFKARIAKTISKREQRCIRDIEVFGAEAVFILARYMRSSGRILVVVNRHLAYGIRKAHGQLTAWSVCTENDVCDCIGTFGTRHPYFKNGFCFRYDIPQVERTAVEENNDNVFIDFRNPLKQSLLDFRDTDIRVTGCLAGLQTVLTDRKNDNLGLLCCVYSLKKHCLLFLRCMGLLHRFTEALQTDVRTKHRGTCMEAHVCRICLRFYALMNKGLEIIEAMRLYRLPLRQVDAVIHRQSIVHSLVEFHDGAMLAQLGTPDMKLPIRYAMTYPNRAVSPAEPLDLLKCPPLTFAEPDEEVFRCLKIAKQCAAIGNVYCAAMNGANEEAVAAFLCDEIGICAIPDLIEAALDKTETVYQPQLSDILEADRLAREVVREKLN